MKKAVLLLLIALLVLANTVTAGLSNGALDDIDLDNSISAEDKELAQQVIAPIWRIFNIARVIISLLSVLSILVAGIKYIAGSLDTHQTEGAKKLLTGVLVGNALLWLGPLILMLII